METLQRNREPRSTTMLAGGPAGTGGSSLQDMLASGQRFLKAGNDAINRVLTKGRSEKFLAAIVQTDGQ